MDSSNEREKVIEGFEMSYRYSNVDEDNTLVPQQLVLDTLALLKAQEPVKTKHNNGITHWYVSAECDSSVSPGDQYCPKCGRRLKWNA